MKELTRERTFTWSSPLEIARSIVGRDPMQWLREMQSGAISAPPAAQLLGMTIESVEEGRIVFSMRAEEWMANPMNVIHGGLTSTILDTVLTLAVQTKLPPERYGTTLNLNVQFVRPIAPSGGTITAEGVAIHVGKTVGTAEASAFDANGKLVAHATATLAILESAV